MIIVVISVALHLANKGEHTMLYKINKNVYGETSKIIISVSYTHLTLPTNHRV